MNGSIPALEREAQLHGDMLIADIVDSYRNNTAKVGLLFLFPFIIWRLQLLYSFRYAFEPGNGCPKPDFVLLIDDDYMLSTHNLIRLLDQKSSQDLVSSSLLYLEFIPFSSTKDGDSTRLPSDSSFTNTR